MTWEAVADPTVCQQYCREEETQLQFYQLDAYIQGLDGDVG